VYYGKEFPYHVPYGSIKWTRRVSRALWAGIQLKELLSAIGHAFRHIDHSFPPDPGWLAYYRGILRDVLHINRKKIDQSLLKRGWIMYRWTCNVYRLIAEDEENLRSQ